jgi:hypothetical protein
LDSAWRQLAIIAIGFFREAPRAMLLPDGLLVAHGGVPHVDRHSTFTEMADLEKPSALEDFVWTRLHGTAKKRIPNRSTRGCSLGIEDFNSFCLKLEELSERRVTGMIRGHDHLEKRFGTYPRYHQFVLTINSMCHRLGSELSGEFAMPLIVAEYEQGRTPTIHRLNVPAQVIEAIYGGNRDAPLNSEFDAPG